MARYEVTSPTGERFEVNGPDGATNEQVMEFAKSQWAQAPAKAKPADPSLADKVLASMPGRFMKGVNSVVEGAAEVVPHALGVVSELGGLNPNPVADTLYGLSRKARQFNKDGEAAYEGAKQRTGVEGTDWMRLGGNLTASTVMGLAGPAAPVTTAGRAAFGAGMGGLAGGFTPTMEPDDQKYAEKKAGQVALGSLAGGVATPLVGKAVDAAGPVIDKGANAMRSLVGVTNKVDEPQLLERVRFELARENVDLNMFPDGVKRQMVAEVSAALRNNKNLDGASLLRKFDMDHFGGGTQGQITRDSGQWREEFNLRNVKGIGDPLLDQVKHIRQETGRRLSEYGGAAPGTAYDRGNTAMRALMGADKPVNKSVNDLYSAAKNTTGRDSFLKPYQFSDLVEKELSDGPLRAALPAEIRGHVNDIATGKTPFNVDTATQLQSILSDSASTLRAGGQKQAALAVDRIKDALLRTDLEAGADPAAREAFAAAKKMAAARFGTLRDVPALKAALEGDVDPEKFLDTFVIKGSIDELRNLTEVMPQSGQQAMREHVVKFLQERAFGPNAVGDGDMAVNNYLKGLNGIGKEKLSMLFPKDIVDDLYRIGRVNAYVTQQPAGVVAARSGTAQMMMNNVFSRIKGMSLALPVVKGFVDTGRLNRALSPAVPVEEIPVLTPALQRLLPAIPLGAGLGSE